MSLGLACVQCEAFWGASWYWNPHRWGTTDGYVPFPVLWDAWRSMQSVAAWQRLQATQSAALGHPVPEERLSERQRSLEAIERLAYPED